ncbi:MAG: hypothetical protein MUP47_09075 [Phycisphaerae bacterium]|nr:hypothetical protein [Phycisphaerae bacterium]
MRRGGESILAVHPGALGDVILFAHLLRHLGGQAALVAGGEKAHLLEGLGAVGAAMDFNALPMHEVFSDVAPEQCQLAALWGRHDRLISCFGAGAPAAEARLAAMCGARSATFLPVRPPADFPGHLLEFWTQRMGLEPLPPVQAPWPVPPAWRARAAEVLVAAGVSAGGRYVVIHPGAGAPGKCWALERFVELAGMLKRDSGMAAVWVLGPVEQERWEEARAERLAAGGAVLPPVELATLAGVLAGAVGFVGNDSGPAHLAAAVGAVTVAVASQASARQFAPLGSAVAIVAEPALADISPAVVERALRRAVWGPSERSGEGGSFNNRK